MKPRRPCTGCALRLLVIAIFVLASAAIGALGYVFALDDPDPYWNPALDIPRGER